MKTTFLSAVVLVTLEAATFSPAGAAVVPAPGYRATLVASAPRQFGMDGLEYNPVTDTWLAIDIQGMDYIVEARRDGSLSEIAYSFGLGGLGDDNLAVTANNLAWVTEQHARSIYTLVPATTGATKTLVGNAPGDPNGPGAGEYTVCEADLAGDLIVGFGRPIPGTPTQWFKVSQPSGPITYIFSTAGRSLSWLQQDPTDGTYYALDLYDSTNSDPEHPYRNYSQPRLVTFNPNSGWATDIRQYSNANLRDIEVDRSGDLLQTDVIWAVKNTTEVVPLSLESTPAGEMGPAILQATDGWKITSLALAPAAPESSTMALYVGVHDSVNTCQLYKVTPEPSSLLMLLCGALCLAGLARVFRARQ